MKFISLTICLSLVLLLSLSSAYAGGCFEGDVADCKVKAEQGYAPAQYNLGGLYDNGEGVIQDDVMAHMYWNVAAVSGDKDAAKNRGIIAKRMTPSQLAEAQKLAREWMRNH